MQYWKDGKDAAGPCIYIFPSGDFNVGEYYIDANGGLDYRHTEYKTDGTTEIRTIAATHHSFQNLAEPSAGFLGIGTRQEYQHLKVVASLDMHVHGRIVDYQGETKELDGVWLPHGRGVM